MYIVNNHSDILENHYVVYGFILGATISSLACVYHGHSCWDMKLTILKHAVEMSISTTLASLWMKCWHLIFAGDFGSVKPVILLAYLKNSKTQ